MQIEYYYFPACANHEAALGRLQHVLKQENIRADIARIEVTSEDMARSCRFPGSPTIRIDGVDIEPEAPRDQGLKCRIYLSPEGNAGIPSENLMCSALKKHSAG